MKRLFNSALSLKIKLPLSIVLIIAITFAISTGFTLYSFTSVVHSVRSNHLQSAAEVIAENIATQVRQAGRDMVMVASLPNVLQAVQMSPSISSSPQYTHQRVQLTTLFERILRAYGYYNSFYVVNELGEYLVGTTPLTTDLSKSIAGNSFRDAMKKNGFSIGPTIYSSKASRAIIPIFLEIVYNGYGGALVSSLHLPKIVNNALQEAPHEDMYPMVFALSKDQPLQVSSTVNNILQAGPWVEQMRGKPNGILNINVDDIEYTIGFSKVPQTDLYAVTVATDEYMILPATILRQTTLTTNIIAVLVIMLCVCYFTIPVARDISYLSFFAKSITEGKDSALLESKRKDEIGHLARSLGHMVTTLKDMVVRSEAATKAKSDFLACMSHEIRTPMNGILGTTHLAMCSNPDEKQLNYLKRIDVAAKTLLGVINDILDFSKIEAKKMDISNTTFRISTMITSMRDMLKPRSDEKDIELEFSVADDVPDIIFSDPLRLAQICINLCSNAIKFTALGRVHMHVALKERQNENLVLLISVKDTGIGIGLEDQQNIFDSFAQADGSTTRKYGGTGLGLTISKSLVQLLGGEIWVESSLNQGSTFSFTIRAIEGFEDDLEDEKEVPQVSSYTIPGLKILLVEDNEINQEIAIEVLKGMGATVILANHGAEAVSIWEKQDVDLILMDIQMPIMDGLTATKEIRNSTKLNSQSIPIIAMTAHAMTGDKEKSIQAGMNDHITKPLNIDELYNVLLFWGTTSKTEQS